MSKRIRSLDEDDEKEKKRSSSLNSPKPLLPPPTKKLNVPPSNVIERIQFKPGCLNDLTIILDPHHQIRCPKQYLYLYSDYFQTLFDSPWSNSDIYEYNNNSSNMPVTMEDMTRFLAVINPFYQQQHHFPFLTRLNTAAALTELRLTSPGIFSTIMQLEASSKNEIVPVCNVRKRQGFQLKAFYSRVVLDKDIDVVKFIDWQSLRLAHWSLCMPLIQAAQICLFTLQLSRPKLIELIGLIHQYQLQDCFKMQILYQQQKEKFVGVRIYTEQERAIIQKYKIAALPLLSTSTLIQRRKRNDTQRNNNLKQLVTLVKSVLKKERLSNDEKDSMLQFVLSKMPTEWQNYNDKHKKVSIIDLRQHQFKCMGGKSWVTKKKLALILETLVSAENVTLTIEEKEQLKEEKNKLLKKVQVQSDSSSSSSEDSGEEEKEE